MSASRNRKKRAKWRLKKNKTNQQSTISKKEFDLLIKQFDKITDFQFSAIKTADLPASSVNHSTQQAALTYSPQDIQRQKYSFYYLTIKQILIYVTRPLFNTLLSIMPLQERLQIKKQSNKITPDFINKKIKLIEIINNFADLLEKRILKTNIITITLLKSALHYARSIAEIRKTMHNAIQGIDAEEALAKHNNLRTLIKNIFSELDIGATVYLEESKKNSIHFAASYSFSETLKPYLINLLSHIELINEKSLPTVKNPG